MSDALLAKHKQFTDHIHQLQSNIIKMADNPTSEMSYEIVTNAKQLREVTAWLIHNKKVV